MRKYSRQEIRAKNFEDRPITPMRVSYEQAAKRSGEGNELNRSPTREVNERTLKNNRTLSASQRTTMNSMSQTIGPRRPANVQQQHASSSPSRTIGSASRHRPPADDGWEKIFFEMKFSNPALDFFFR